ncbi:MAG TPA: SPOR domain-containing protein [Terracidiphilus sp.]|jgi:cell division septation protein DedD
MRGVFDDREYQEPEPRQDTELTLGSTTLLLIFFGLVLLCGLCFGLGYATGRHGSQETAAALQTAGTQTTASTDSGRQKPTANAQTSAVGAGSSGTTSSAQNPTVISSAASPSSPLQVKPALGSSANPALAALPADSAVGPALAAPGSLMVQIAAVSQQEDADVLMSALRRHGYTVAARREPLDGLIHVRIGPFKSRDEAEKARQKLLNDGYNAIVQP